MPTDINWYNESSAAKLGWEPNWFGDCEYFDIRLSNMIMDFQREHGLDVDGMCGPGTFRRIFLQREAEIDEYEEVETSSDNSIVYNGNFIPIEWDKVVLWSEPNGLKAQKGHYRSWAGKPPREISQFVNHWDVCVSSKSCQRVLDKRGISVHFLLDADGTIYQTLDMQHEAWHAGARMPNMWSVGVEINNAYYPKYQKNYTKRGLGQRPIVFDAVVNGQTLDPHMGFYPIQLQALKALWVAVSKATLVHLSCPMLNGKMDTNTHESVRLGHFYGIVHHYHLTRRKIDCAGMDLDKMLKEIHDENEAE